MLKVLRLQQTCEIPLWYFLALVGLLLRSGFDFLSLLVSNQHYILPGLILPLLDSENGIAAQAQGSKVIQHDTEF